MSLYQAISWVSFVHLFILGFLVLFKARKHQAFKFFAVFLFSFSYVHLNHLFILYHKAADLWMINEIVFLAIFILGPSYLQFVAQMVGIKILWRKYFWIHLVPVFCFLIYYFSFLLTSKQDLQSFYEQSIYRQPLSNTLLTSFAALQKGMYVLWSLYILHQHFKKTGDYTLKWLMYATKGLLALCFVIAPIMIFIADKEADIIYVAMPITTGVLYLYFSFKILTHGVYNEEKILAVIEQKYVANNLSGSFKEELDKLLYFFDNPNKKTLPGTELKQKVYDINNSFKKFLRLLNED
ncbi:hypothetical protein [Pseudopedobacter beijingensis]|uniref:Histidine kinase N-terminal 7TM region domain-containing protein n=1 Tax=Pseudopedobacter beijingensis TaxID=1207056 RepID=A0ABW4IB20_9SPHI